MKQKICIDFDNTIAEIDETWNPIGIKPGVKQAINTLKENFIIAIFSSRNWPGIYEKYGDTNEFRMTQMVDFLNENGIYHDKIITSDEGKYEAEYYIDDRAIEFKDNWGEITTRIMSKFTLSKLDKIVKGLEINE